MRKLRVERWLVKWKVKQLVTVWVGLGTCNSVTHDVRFLSGPPACGGSSAVTAQVPASAQRGNPPQPAMGSW